MSWRSATSLILPAALGLATAGCGFHPLYGDQAMSVPAGLERELASIRVVRIPDRPGQMMTNRLTDAFNPHALSVAAAYELEVKLVVKNQNYDIRSDSTTGRNETIVSADWALVRLSDHQPVLTGASKALTGHDVLTQEYANVASGDADRTHGIAEVGDDIETRIGLYFQGRHGS